MVKNYKTLSSFIGKNLTDVIQSECSLSSLYFNSPYRFHYIIQLSLPTDKICCSDGQIVTSSTSAVCALNKVGLMSGVKLSSLSLLDGSTLRSLMVRTKESQQAVNAKQPSLERVKFWMKWPCLAYLLYTLP